MLNDEDDDHWWHRCIAVSAATIKSTPVYLSNTGREGQACQTTATIKNGSGAEVRG